MHSTNVRKAVLAGAVGNVVEWYDFGLYSILSTTLAATFFPKSNPTAALLSTLAVFALGFLIRPLGGIILGALGDRIGRRPTLLISIMLMSAGTVALGVLPGYRRIGIAAPILLLGCRLLQGFSTGGEFSSSVIFITEHAPVDRRGRYASVTQVTLSAATIIGTVTAALTIRCTSAQQLASWGWRVPFLAAAPLALIGLYLRWRVAESPVFTSTRADRRVESTPLISTLGSATRPMLILIGWSMTNEVGYYLMTTFLLPYLTRTAKFTQTESLLVLIVAVGFLAVGATLAGRIIDAVGRKRVAVAYALGLGLWAVPAFALLQHGSLVTASLVVAVYATFEGGISTMACLLIAELFPVHIRSSASAVSYQVSTAVFGGSAPYLATWLVAGGQPLAPGYYLASLCAISTLVATLGIGNHTRPQEIQPADI